MKLPLIFLIFILPLIQDSSSPGETYIRYNQAGYLPGDLKSAVVFSEFPVTEKQFFLINTATNEIEYTGQLIPSQNSFKRFRYFYSADFSRLKKPGNYIIKVSGIDSRQFNISPDIYNDIVDSLMLFFKEQRCGPTDPIMHKTCHLWDVAGIEGESRKRQIDVTGGWHDAGDYLKFVSTTAFTTYLMIFSYVFDESKFGFDNNRNSVPDVLEEAKVGLDWLLRCNYEKDSLITRVQDLRDHNVKWRLPENDPLRYSRKASTVITKSEAGIYSAALALAASVWNSKFKSTKFSELCLHSALNIYQLMNRLPAVKDNDSLMYRDENYYDEYELAAVELFNITEDSSYLHQAENYGEKARADYWWSYGDISSLAHYRLALHLPQFAVYIRKNIDMFSNRMRHSAFNEGMNYSWGTTTSFLGISLQSILYQKLNVSFVADSLFILPRDFVLGRNLWGLSFIHGIGSRYPIHQHSQVGYFNYGNLPGALSSGPAPAFILDRYKLNFNQIPYDNFNSDSLRYNDNYADYITNEPTLTGNATAFFVYGFFSNR